jgi:hypothetical protein
MKTIGIITLFAVIAVFPTAADWEESYHLVERLITLPGPGEPRIIEDSVVFTASSKLRKVGVAFAHEDFSKVYWYRQLMLPQDPVGAPIPPGQKFPDPYIDSGILFHVFAIPENMKELGYKLIINGLWTVDTTNPRIFRDPISGVTWSLLSLPLKPSYPDPLKGLPAGLNFSFKGPPGETVTVAGDFNGWDPFMYELRENPAGVYSLTIPMPPGTYQYVFFHRGRRYVDPYNPRRIYARDGTAASEIIVK